MVYEISFDQDSEGFFVLSELTKDQLASSVLHVMEVADKLIIDSHIDTSDICTILVRYFDCNLASEQECDRIFESELWSGGSQANADFDLSSKTDLITRYIESHCVTWNNRDLDK